MAVYDEYVKNQGPGQGNDGIPQPNGTENANPAGEEPKVADA